MLALAILAFPISTAAASSPKQQLIFRVDPSLRKPQILQVYGPPKPANLPEKKEKPKPKLASKTTKVSTSSQKLGFNPCNCWSYVKFKRAGIMPLGYGWAKNYPVNSQTPQVGAIIITYEGSKGHMGIVAGVTETKVIVDDYNYKRCGHTIRELPINSKLIKGYIL